MGIENIVLVIGIDGKITFSRQIIENTFEFMGFKRYPVFNQRFDHFEESQCIHVIRHTQSKIRIVQVWWKQMNAVAEPTEYYLKGMASAM